jgi:putative oxidoreductase
MDQFTSTLPSRSVVSSHATTLERIEPYVLSILRIMVGFLFCEHGTAKLFGFPPHGPIQHFPDIEFFAGSIECFGGALLALGLFSRVVAFLMSGEMAIAYFMMHAPKSFPVAQWRRRGRAVLLYFPAPRGRRSRTLVPRRAAVAQTRLSESANDDFAALFIALFILDR